MSEVTHVQHRFPALHIVLITLVVAGLLGFSTSPASAATSGVAAASSSTRVAEAADLRDSSAMARSGAHIRPAINWYGCPGLVSGARSLQVAAFALGYCPSIWFLQSTSPGRAIVNTIVNGACKIPWMVRAATLGKFSTC